MVLKGYSAPKTSMSSSRTTFNGVVEDNSAVYRSLAKLSWSVLPPNNHFSLTLNVNACSPRFSPLSIVGYARKFLQKVTFPLAVSLQSVLFQTPIFWCLSLESSYSFMNCYRCYPWLMSGSRIFMNRHDTAVTYRQASFNIRRIMDGYFFLSS